MRRLLPALILLSGCAHDYFSGMLDLQRVEKGEVFIDSTVQAGDRITLRAVVEVDAPAWRLMNVLRNVDEYPLWDTSLSRVSMLAHQGNQTLAEFEFTPILGLQFAPVRQNIRFDADRGEISMTAFGNDWMREGQLVVKLKAAGDGSRTLVTLFWFGQVKVFAPHTMIALLQTRYATSAVNLRRIVQLPQYAEHVVPAPPPHRLRVGVPPFAAEGVSMELARTLTRIFAEELTRSSGWDISTPQEIAALLSSDAQQKLEGCDGKAGCVAAIGKELGADRIVTGTVSRIGERLVLDASLLKLPDASVERHVSRDAEESANVRDAAAELARP